MPGNRKRPVVAVLYREELPPRVHDIEQLAEVRAVTADKLADALTGADVLYQWHSFSPALRDNWQAASSLQWIHVSAAGVTAAVRGTGPQRRYLYKFQGRAQPRHCRVHPGFRPGHRQGHAGLVPAATARQWQHRVTRKIQGRRVLVVGTGSIGREIARLLRAVGMDVSGAGRSSRPGDRTLHDIHSSGNLAGVVGSFDFVVLAAPLTRATRGMIGTEVLAAMKPSAHVINVGRGELIQTDALVHALTSGGIAGAALDVVHPEPLPAGHPLWNMRNVTLTPHMSGDTEAYLEDLAELFVRNLQRFVQGEPLVNVVDKSLGFVP